MGPHALNLRPIHNPSIVRSWPSHPTAKIYIVTISTAEVYHPRSQRIAPILWTCVNLRLCSLPLRPKPLWPISGAGQNHLLPSRWPSTDVITTSSLHVTIPYPALNDTTSHLDDFIPLINAKITRQCQILLNCQEKCHFHSFSM